MALVKQLIADDRSFNGIHPTVIECKYIIAENDGKVIIQLNSYGSSDREIEGKLSQTLQFDLSSAKQLHEVLGRMLANNGETQ